MGLDADAKRQSAETANEATYDLASGSGLPALYEEPASVKKPKSKKPKKEKKEKKEIPTAEAELNITAICSHSALLFAAVE